MLSTKHDNYAKINNYAKYKKLKYVMIANFEANFNKKIYTTNDKTTLPHLFSIAASI